MEAYGVAERIKLVELYFKHQRSIIQPHGQKAVSDLPRVGIPCNVPIKENIQRVQQNV